MTMNWFAENLIVVKIVPYCFHVYLCWIDGDYVWKDHPDDSLFASRMSQATRVSEVIVRVNGLHNIAKVYVATEGRIWLSYTLNRVSATL